MPSHKRTPGLAEDGRAAAEDRCDRLGRDDVDGQPEQVHRRQGAAAHRVDIGQRVGRGDLPKSERIIDDRREEIDGLDEGAVAIDAVNTGVVGGAGVDETSGIAGGGC
jgi:hypothetical protein